MSTFLCVHHAKEWHKDSDTVSLQSLPTHGLGRTPCFKNQESSSDPWSLDRPLRQQLSQPSQWDPDDAAGPTSWRSVQPPPHQQTLPSQSPLSQPTQSCCWSAEPPNIPTTSYPHAIGRQQPGSIPSPNPYPFPQHQRPSSQHQVYYAPSFPAPQYPMAACWPIDTPRNVYPANDVEMQGILLSHATQGAAHRPSACHPGISIDQQGRCLAQTDNGLVVPCTHQSFVDIPHLPRWNKHGREAQAIVPIHVYEGDEHQQSTASLPVECPPASLPATKSFVVERGQFAGKNGDERQPWGGARGVDPKSRLRSIETGKEAARRAFAQSDWDGSNSLDPREFMEVVQELGYSINYPEALRLFGSLDSDMNGKIGLTEFQEFYISLQRCAD